jgi:hypothetical protein
MLEHVYKELEQYSILLSKVSSRCYIVIPGGIVNGYDMI